jgi:hypothetical protein
MIYASNNRSLGTNEPADSQPATDFDAFIIDSDFDDALDLELAAFRETLSDSRYF